jgi:hypothetical protein
MPGSAVSSHEQSSPDVYVLSGGRGFSTTPPPLCVTTPLQRAAGDADAVEPAERDRVAVRLGVVAGGGVRVRVIVRVDGITELHDSRKPVYVTLGSVRHTSVITRPLETYTSVGNTLPDRLSTGDVVEVPS